MTAHSPSMVAPRTPGASKIIISGPPFSASLPGVYHHAYGSRIDLDPSKNISKVSSRQPDPRNMRIYDVKATTA